MARHATFFRVVSRGEPTPSLAGHIVGAEGRAVDGDGVVLVTATGDNLVRIRPSREPT